MERRCKRNVIFLVSSVLVVILLLFFDPGTQLPGNEKITLCNTEKYKNPAAMNVTPPPPSRNSHAVLLLVVVV